MASQLGNIAEESAADVPDAPSAAAPLAREQVSRFRSDGFLLCPGVFAFDEIAWLRHETDILARRWSATHSVSADAAWAGESPAGTLYGLHRVDASLGRLAHHPRLVEMARQILGGAVQVYQSRLVHRQMTLDETAAWRRDFATWSAVDGMKRPRALTIAVVLGDVGPQGIELNMARGSQRTPHAVDSAATQTIAATTGDVLVYDANLAYALAGAPNRRGAAIVFIAYNLLGNEAACEGRDAIFADGSAPAAITESDDCLWPSALCAAG